MDDPRLVIFNAVLLLSALAGYVARRRGWLHRDRAAWFMKAAIIVFETPLALLSVWRLNMAEGSWKLPLAGAILVTAMLLVGFGLGRGMRLGRLQVPSFAFSASMSNIGYTLAGFIALALIGPEGPGYQFIYVLFWPFYVFLVIFSIGHHYASPAPLRPWQLVWRSLTDIRSLPLYSVTAGILLSRFGPPYPREVLARTHVVDVLFVGGIVCSYVAIGLSTVLRAMRPYLAQSLITCVLKFVLTPALMLSVVTLLGVSGAARQLCLLQAFMPTAVYSVMVATLFGTDRDLTVTNFLVSHVVFLAVILPLVLPWAIRL